ncbi:unnamed protein product, partial [Adineta ricciae]
DINSDDSQWIGPALFQALDTFCQTANRVISNALTQFYSAQYISAIVTPSHIFTLQTETSINQSIALSKLNFFLAISTIQNATQANILKPAKHRNCRFEYSDQYAGSPSNDETIVYNFSDLHGYNQPV